MVEAMMTTEAEVEAAVLRVIEPAFAAAVLEVARSAGAIRRPAARGFFSLHIPTMKVAGTSQLEQRQRRYGSTQRFAHSAPA